MTCATCAGRVENALMRVTGVVEAHVNLVSEKADVLFLSGATSAADLILAVDNAGYSAEVSITHRDDDAQAARDALRQQHDFIKLISAFALTAPLLLPMMGVSLPLWLQWVLATPMQFYFGARFYRAAWSALKHMTGSMDVLIALGTSVAYGYSLWLMFQPHTHHTYFEASSVVIALVMLGKYLEERAKKSTTAAIRALIALRPDYAHVMRGAYEVDIPIDAVVVGDIVMVRPGETIPVDGVIIDGSGSIDESLLTGESLPIDKSRGDYVTGGALNGMSALQIKTRAVGEQSTLAQMIYLVEQAQIHKAPMQKLVDRVASLFVPVVLVCAIMSCAFWMWWDGDIGHALLASVSVMVIACPCALGLATPTAFMVGTGVAARAGILVRDQEALERAQHVTTVVLDKTGTLTEGHLSVAAIEYTDGIDPSDIVRLAASLQKMSEHPVGRAIVIYARHNGHIDLLPAHHFIAHAGQGVSADINGVDYIMGNRSLMSTYHIDISATEPRACAFETTGHTLVWMANRTTNKLMAMIALRDQIKPTTSNALAHLRAMGLHLIMLTGDHERTAQAIAQELGIDDVRAGVLPEGKVNVIAQLQAQGHIIAMVGDGINDAPALARADIGIAMGTGADVAMHAASLTLMRGDPCLIADALDISRATFRTIRRGLFWAFIYNIIGIPIAAAGWLNPMLAGAAMAVSSLSVVLNALLLRRWRPRTMS
jgi:P-type Cu+ transporter